MKNMKLRILPLLLVAGAVSIPTIGSVTVNNIDSQNSTVISSIKYSDPEPTSTPTLTPNVTTFTEAFPDENFRGAIGPRIRTGYVEATDANTTLSSAEIERITNTITTINIASRSVRSAAGIEHFRAVETIHAQSNSLATFDASPLTSLKVLYLNTNGLINLNLGSITQLTDLRITTNNLVGHLDLSNLSSLKTLHSWANKLTGINFGNTSTVEDLRCQDNEITSLDISQFTQLNTFNASANPLDTLILPETSKEKLVSFNIIRTNIGNIDLAGYSSLTFFNGTLSTNGDFSKTTQFAITGSRGFDEPSYIRVDYPLGGFSWTQGYYVITPNALNTYQIVLDYNSLVTDRPANSGSTFISLADGGLMDEEGNLIVGALVSDIQSDGSVLLSEGGSIITPKGTLSSDGPISIKSGVISTTGQSEFSINHVTPTGQLIVGGSVIGIEKGDASIDMYEATITLEDGGVIISPLGDAIVSAGSIAVNRHGQITTDDKYATMSNELVDEIKYNDDGTTDLPSGTVIISSAGDSTKIVSGTGTLETDGTIIIKGKDGSLQFSNGNTVDFSNGAIVNDNQSITTPPNSLITLPNGDVVLLLDTSTIDADGNVATEGVIITIPSDGTVIENDDGTRTIPQDSAFIAGEKTVSLTDGTARIDENGEIALSNNGEVTFDNGKSIYLPNGGVLNPIVPEVTIGNNHGATLPNDDKIILPNGGSIDSDGNITTTGPIVRVPAGNTGEAIVNDNGTITVPSETVVTLQNGNEIVFPNGGVFDPATGNSTHNPGKPIILPNGDAIISNEVIVLDENGEVVLPSNGSFIIVNKDDVDAITINDNGTVVPGGSSVLSETGKDYVLPNGGTLLGDDTVKIDNEGSVILPGGELVFPNGGIFDPSTGNSTINPGKPIVLPNGDVIITNEVIVIDENGEVVPPSNGNYIVVPSDKVDDIEDDDKGNVVAPGGSTVVTPSGDEYELPNGGTFLDDGTVKLDDNGSVVLPDGETIDFPHGGIFDPSTGLATQNADPDASNNVDGTAAIVAISIILALATIAAIGFTIVVINKSKKD